MSLRIMKEERVSFFNFVEINENIYLNDFFDIVINF